MMASKLLIAITTMLTLASSQKFEEEEEEGGFLTDFFSKFPHLSSSNSNSNSKSSSVDYPPSFSPPIDVSALLKEGVAPPSLPRLHFPNVAPPDPSPPEFFEAASSAKFPSGEDLGLSQELKDVGG